MAVDISVVVPVYGCPGALPELHRRLVAVLEGMGKSFEIVLVDDHDPQNSWEGIERLCALDERWWACDCRAISGRFAPSRQGSICAKATGSW